MMTEIQEEKIIEGTSLSIKVVFIRTIGIQILLVAMTMDIREKERDHDQEVAAVTEIVIVGEMKEVHLARTETKPE